MKKVSFLSICLVFVLGLVVYSCSSDNEYTNLPQEEDRIEFQNEVMMLAQKYNLEVEFLDSYCAPNDDEFKSLEEIEEIFSQIDKYTKKTQTFNLYKETESDGKVYYKMRNGNRSLVKTRSEIYGFSEWVFNLSWFSVTLIEDDGTCEVLTDFTGLSFYSYTQNYASGSCNGNTISFNATGTLKATIASVVGIKLSYTVTADGSYDKKRDEGSVSLNCY